MVGTKATADENGAEANARSSLFVGSTKKAFQVLEAFNGPHRYMSLAEIARAAGLDRSATQRLVHTLEQLGYLRRSAGSTLYGLTSKVLGLSYNFLRSNELVDKASPYLLDLSRTLGETVNLQELDGPEVVFLARFHGQHLVNVNFAVGSRLPAVFTAAGLCMLSHCSDAQKREVLRQTDLKPVTPFTEVDPGVLLARMDMAAQKGYALAMNETVMGDITVAAAITNHTGQAVASVTIAVPTSRYTLETAEALLAQHVQVAATSISQSKFQAMRVD